ncbi:hypothetical protein C4K68_03345 [Pokkaliibacter plantistimulans]|uniref:Aldose 1-epimerase n=1 Tax=Proteobacteria bacterium 228 TaxID=2083153 RepID=A0A2S5KW11_9PROT|nr:hypothetical protein [Pokkaliibacter plantistimulans]PPC78885.1 hypothetical protein C4K68_03345 [Pokkaliibacter plantistimulans]
MQPTVLANAVWTLHLLPEWGGRIAALQAEGLDILTPIRSHHFDPLDWPRAGAYPLFPYSNRLRQARLQFQDQHYHLPAHPAALPHTLHGIGHTLPWHITAQADDSLTLTCDYQGEHWPWRFRAEQCFTLQGNTLLMTLSLRNQDSSPMPGGLGLHPYFQRHPGMVARFHAERDWQLQDDYLTTGSYRPGGDMRIDVPLDDEPASATALAHYLSEWDGLLQLDYAPQVSQQGSRRQLQLEASSTLSHFVAFAPADAPYLCLEPVSHLADAFNFPPSRWPETGTQVLQPGESLTASLSWHWQSL